MAFSAEDPEPASPTPGSLPYRLRYFGDYELLEEISRGGSGVVFKGRQLSLNRIIALKMLLFGRLANEEFVRRFRVEAEAEAVLQHPNIVRIHEVGEHEGQPYFAMDFVDGESLAEIAAHNPIRPKLAAEYLKTIAAAIHYAHQRGILHRDLKPSNILIDPMGQPRITDFGLAKRLGEASDLTLSGQVLGTPQFMSPEQALGHRGEVTVASDVYSLGAILYYLLTTRPLFVADSVEGILHQVLHTDATPPRQLNPSVPRDMETICLKCLEKDARRRYGSAQDLADELACFLENRPIQARPVRPLERLFRWGRRHPATSTGVTLGLLLLLTVAFGSSIMSWRLENARRATDAERDRTVMANKQLIETVGLLELQRAEQLFDANDPSLGLASLARLLRQHPTNTMVADRILSALLYRDWAVPAALPVQHAAPVCWLEYSPDGRLIVSASHDHTARIWNAQSCQAAFPPLQHSDRVLSSRFSPNSLRVATGSADRTARIWNACTGLPVGLPLPHKDAVSCVAFSPDGHRLATGCKDGVARVWDSDEGTPLAEFALHTGPIRFVQFSPDGRTIASASEDGSARIWNSITALPIGSPLLHRGPVNVVQFNPDGTLLLTASDDTTARLWQVDTTTPVGDALQHNGIVSWAAFSPDGKKIVTASSDYTARVWSTRSRQPLTYPLRHESQVCFAKFSPDGNRIATACGDNAAYLWDTRTGQQACQRMRQQERIVALDFSPDGLRLAMGGYAKLIQVWDIRPGKAVAPMLQQPGLNSASIDCADVSPEGDSIAVNDSRFTVRVWNLITLSPLTSPLNHDKVLRFVRFSPDGKTLLTAGENMVRLWNLRSKQPLGDPLLHQDMIRQARFSFDGDSIATASADHTARLWNAHTGLPSSPPLKHDGIVRDVQFSLDGRRVATASEDRCVRIWDPRNGQLLKLIQAHADCIEALQFSPDGQLLVTGADDNTARVWDVLTGKPVSPPLQHSRSVFSVAFSPDGSLVGTGSLDTTARVWDAHTGRAISQPMKHDSLVSSVSFSRDGQRLLTCCDFGIVRVWDSRVGLPLSEPLRHETRLHFAFWPRDNRHVIVAQADYGIRLWEIPPPFHSVPSWLAKLAESFAGIRYNNQNSLELVPKDEFFELRRQLCARPPIPGKTPDPGAVNDYSSEPTSAKNRDYCSRFAQWLFADRLERSLSPSSWLSISDYLQRSAQTGTLNSIREMLAIAPYDQTVSLRLGQLEAAP